MKNYLRIYNQFFFIHSSNVSTLPANIGLQDVPTTSPSNVLRTFPKDPIWPFLGRLDLTSQARINLTSWGSPETTSKERTNLTSRNVPGRLIRGEPRTFSRRPPRGPSKHSNLDVPRFLLTFLSELIRLTKSI